MRKHQRLNWECGYFDLNDMSAPIKNDLRQKEMEQGIMVKVLLRF